MNPNARPFVPSWIKPTEVNSPTEENNNMDTPVEAEVAEVKNNVSNEADKLEKPAEKEDWEEESQDKTVSQPEEDSGAPTSAFLLEKSPATTHKAEVEENEDDLEVEIESDPRDHLNIVFIGHVDAGKSTIAGNILYITGMVDKRTIEKYEKEAKEKNRGTWFLAYIMDTNEEERAKGKTVEVGRATFETNVKRYTILDAPGHKNYVPNMIGGAAQADVGILVISARQGEFEAGFERGGQTREHAMLAKTIGIRQLVVVINKMDEKNWSKERYDEIVNKLNIFLKKECQYSPKDLIFLPISGFTGINLKEPVSKTVCPWFEGKTLLQTLDDLPPVERNDNLPLRMPITDKYKDMGLLSLLGRIEAGTVARGQTVVLMPNRNILKVNGLYIDDKAVKKAKSGENARIAVSGLEDTDVSSGFVLCDAVKPVNVVTEFLAQLFIVELLPSNPLFSAGYDAVMHIHTCIREVTVLELVSEVDKKTRQPTKKKVTFVKSGAIVNARLQTTTSVCLELFELYPQLGRFTLRDKGKTIAIGKVTKIN